MSPDDFTNLASEYRAIGATLRGVGLWLGNHPNVRFIEPKRVADDLPEVTERELVRALSMLVSEGRLHVYYKVRPRTGHTFVNALFSSVNDIPRNLRGAFDEAVDLDDAEIVAVFGGQVDSATAT